MVIEFEVEGQRIEVFHVPSDKRPGLDDPPLAPGWYWCDQGEENPESFVGPFLKAGGAITNAIEVQDCYTHHPEGAVNPLPVALSERRGLSWPQAFFIGSGIAAVIIVARAIIAGGS